MLAVIIALLLGSGGNLDPTEYVDCIEKNQVVNQFGEVRLTQIIYWRYTHRGRRVAAWRIFRESDLPVQRINGRFLDLWMSSGKRYRCYADFYCETKTTVDPEVEDAKKFSIESREWRYPSAAGRMHR